MALDRDSRKDLERCHHQADEWGWTSMTRVTAALLSLDDELRKLEQVVARAEQLAGRAFTAPGS